MFPSAAPDYQPAPAQVTELLALSDERDQWMKRILDAQRDAYAAGWADGRNAHRAAVNGIDRASDVLDRPTTAELEIRRWGTGGRDHFGDALPGDRSPSKAHRREAA